MPQRARVGHKGSMFPGYPRPWPATINLTSPGNKVTTVNPSAATLVWGNAGTTVDYRVHVGLTNPPAFLGTWTGLGTVLTGLNASTVYYWQITPTRDGGGTPSTIWEFTTTP